MTEPKVGHRHASALWLMAGLACAGSFVALYLWAVRTEPGQEWDITLFARLQMLGETAETLASLLRWLLPALLAVLYALLALTRLRQRRFAAVIGTVLLGVLSIGSARVLRLNVLGRPDLGDYGYFYNTYPSGHVAATTALAAAVLILAGRRWRLRVAAAVVPLVAVACLASVIGHAHRPSDVLGAVLLVGAIAAAGLTLPVTDRAR